MAENTPIKQEKKQDGVRIGLIIFSILLLATTAYFAVRTSTLSTEKTEVVEKNTTMEAEIKQLDDLIAKKEGELTNKEAHLKEINDRLEKANERIRLLEQTGGLDRNRLEQFKNKVKEYELKLTEMQKSLDTVTQEKIVVVKENSANTEQIKSLQSKTKELESNLNNQKAESERLQNALKAIYRVTDVKLTDAKDQVGVRFKKGKMKTFKIAYKVLDVDNKLLPTGLAGTTVLITGLGKHNAGFNKTWKPYNGTGAEMLVKIENEKFETGLYKIDFLHNGTTIGQSNFEVDSFL